MDGRTVCGRENKTLLRATKNRKFWRVIIAHIVKGHSTKMNSFFGCQIFKLIAYK